MLCKEPPNSTLVFRLVGVLFRVTLRSSRTALGINCTAVESYFKLCCPNTFPRTTWRRPLMLSRRTPNRLGSVGRLMVLGIFDPKHEETPSFEQVSWRA